MNKLELQKTANEIRKGIVTAVHSAKAGSSRRILSAADLFTYLYFEEMNIDPKDRRNRTETVSFFLRDTQLPVYIPLWLTELFPGRRSEDSSPSGFLPSGPSGYETYSWCGHVQRFLRTGNFCSSGNGFRCQNGR